MAKDNSKKNADKGSNGSEVPSENTASDFSAALAALPAIPTKIGDMKVTLPRAWVAGMVHTEESALTTDTARVRQFTNNLNANAKLRAENFAEAKTDEDRAKYVPYTLEEILSKWQNYMPSIGGTGRVSANDKMIESAAWTAYGRMISDHNKQVAAGNLDNPVIPKGVNAEGKAVTVSVRPAPRKTKDVTAQAHEASMAEYDAWKEVIVTKMSTLPEYAERFQIELDRLMSEKGAKASKDEAQIEASGDIL